MFKKTILILMGAIIAYCTISILFLLIKKNVIDIQDKINCNGRIVLICSEKSGCTPTCVLFDNLWLSENALNGL